MKKSILYLLLLLHFSTLPRVSFSQSLNVPNLLTPVNGATYQAVNVTLDWSTSAGATGYEIRYGMDSGMNTFNLQTISSSQFSTNQLLFGTAYYWQVRAISSADSSNWSPVWSFNTTDTVILASPLNGQAFMSPDALLDWSSLSGVTGYQIQLDTSIAFNSSLSNLFSIGATSQYTNNNLRFGTTYYWRVRALHNNDTSTWSTIWNFSTTDNISLSSPVNGQLYMSPDALVDWNGISGITGYQVQLDTSSAFNSPLGNLFSIGANSQYTNNSLRFGTTYYWRARALHNSDTSAWSAIWNFSTTDIISLLSPVNGQLYMSPDALVDWSGISGVTGYQVQLDTSAAFNSAPGNLFSIGATSQYTNNSLRFGTTYYWRVRALHNSDTSAWSVIWSFSTTDNINLISPVNGQLFMSPDALVDWSGISGITGYQVQMDTSNAFNSTQSNLFSIGATSQYTNNSLRFGTTYFWRVRALHNTDTSMWSAVWSFTTSDMISPVSPASNAVFQPLNLTLDWTGISGVAGYELYIDTDPQFGNPGIFTSGTISQLSMNNLSYGTVYWWKVRAYHAFDTSEFSTPWNFQTVYQISSVPSLISPINLSLNNLLTDTLTWGDVNDPLVTGYDVEIDQSPSFPQPISVTVTDTVYAYTSLSANTNYYWRVRCMNSSGKGAWSPTWQFTTITSVGTFESALRNEIRIYPNPLPNGEQLLFTGLSIADYRMRIYNMSGQLVTDRSINNGKVGLTLSLLPTSLYEIILLDNRGNQIFQTRLLVKP